MDGGIVADTIKVPGIGAVKKPHLYAGIGVTVGILVWAYFRRSSAAGGDVAPPGDAGMGDPYAQDSDAAGYNTIYPPTNGYWPHGYDVYGNPLPAPSNSTSGGVYNTNLDWSAAAVALLAQGGVTESAAATAISGVLGGLAVTTVQQQYFLRAKGTLGHPPQGYPTPIRTTDSAAHPGTHIPGAKLPRVGNLRVTSRTPTELAAAWAPVTGAKGYAIWLDGRQRQESIVGTTLTLRNLAAATSYRLTIYPLGHDGVKGAGASVTGKTAAQVTGRPVAVVTRSTSRKR